MMTSEEIRMEVLRLIGWQDSSLSKRACFDPTGFSTYWSNAPDPLDDLNIVREAENNLTQDQADKYAEALAKLIPSHLGTFGVIHADAAQRCECLVKTLGLWTD